MPERPPPSRRSFLAAVRKYLAPAALASCIAFSTLLAILKPIPHGHGFTQALKLSLALTGLWLLSRADPAWLFKKAVLIFLLVAGLGVGIGGFFTIDRDAEVIHVYDSVFKAMESGQNPYTSGTIFHRAEFLRPVYGNFNYPPLEIYPYYLAYRLTGRWDSTVLTATMLIIQLFVCLIFAWTFPEVKRLYLLPFMAVFLLVEFKINVAMTFLMAALIVLVIRKDLERSRKGWRLLVAALFGLGMMTKFLLIPVFAAYLWHRFDPKRLRPLGEAATEGTVALAVAALVMVPYGLAAVFKNTILFNLILKDRAVLTTFFPNVLSGFFTWIGHSGLYSLAAVAVLAAAVAAAPRLELFHAMTAAAITFLLVVPTPKAQFLPVVLYLVVAGALIELIRQGRLPAEVQRARLAPPESV